MMLHHIGVVVPSIEDAVEYYRETLGLAPTGPVVFDGIQNARLVMLQDGEGGPGMELIEPASPASPVAEQAHRGGIAHTCWEVNDIAAEIARQREAGALLAKAPVPAVLFGGRRIAFLYLKTRLLIELIEAAKAPANLVQPAKI